MVFYFGKIFKWFFILEKLSSGFFIWNQRYVPTNNLKLHNLFRKIHFKSSNFKLISTLELNLAIKFVKFCDKFLIIQSLKSGTHNVSKTPSSKSIHGDRRYLQFCVRKRVKLTEIHTYK